MNRVFQDLSIIIRANLWLVPVLAGLVTALFYFVAPPPPMSATMSTGAAGGAYAAFAEQLKTELAKEGFKLHLLPSSGSKENTERLLDADSGVQLALVQSGQELTLDADERAALHSLGAVYQEPLWLFTRHSVEINTLVDLQTLRVAIGRDGGGIRMLVDPLMQANGFDLDQLPKGWQGYSGKRALADLQSQQLDAAFFMGAAESELIQSLATDPELNLFNFSRIQAYETRLPFISGLPISRGLLDLAHDQPHQDSMTLAAQALLVVNKDFHPAIAPLVLETTREIMKNGTLVEAHDTWPLEDHYAFNMLAEADYFHRKGLPLLQRYLPFRIASLADRYIILVIPLLVVLFPIFKIAGPVYRWRIRARIYRWYKYLRDIDKQLTQHTLPEQVDAEINHLQSLQNELAKVEVPLSYTHELYELHLHVGYVIQRLQMMQAASAAEATHLPDQSTTKV